MTWHKYIPIKIEKVAHLRLRAALAWSLGDKEDFWRKFPQLNKYTGVAQNELVRIILSEKIWLSYFTE